MIKNGHQVRHLSGVKGNFGIIGKTEYYAYAVQREGEPPSQVIVSNVRSFVESQQYSFEMLWRKAIPAQERIKEIEEGIEPEVIETIRDPVETQSIGRNIISSAKKEILILFSAEKTFYRQDKEGVFDLLRQVATQNPSLKIRILTPLNDDLTNKEEVAQEKKLRETPQKQIQENFDIRHIEPPLQTKVSALIIDRKYSLVVELKEGSQDNYNETIGFATYSNSKATVLSYASIFESLWRQTELYQQLKDANEQLKIHDKMQKEFINIAAHELRNPIQPILSMTAIMGRMEKNKEQQELIDIVTNNARKLKQLAEDILDVTRIESNSLQLNKEYFDLKELVINAIQDYRRQVSKENKIKLEYHEDSEQKYGNKDDSKIMMYADKHRISQVISNLMTNSIKFTRGGIISIKVKIENLSEHETGGSDSLAGTVCIKDTGTGIDPEILPSLFGKFVTKSIGGTGLGLFISKSIVEAHGGKIWAENNEDGQKGATFYFTLPLE